MARANLGLGIALGMLAATVGAVMWFKWNADGPGTHGGGEDLDRQIEAPMAAPMQPPESALTQRRHERASIAGTVRDDHGLAIAGARVCAAASSELLSASDTRWPRCTFSDPDGRYRIEDLHGVRQRVSAGALGYLPADHLHLLAGVRRRAIDLRPGGVAQDIDITLAPGGVEIRGVVNDLHGLPIADAWVASGGAEQGNGVVSVQTAADGSYALSVRPGTVTVTAQAVGHVPASTTGASEGHDFTLWLAPASLLRGRAVRADNGDPVDGAWVRANPGGNAVKTDPAGHFLFDALPPGIYTPRVETEDGLGILGHPVTLGLGESSTLLQIAVTPAMFVEGRLMFANGELCDDGSLTLRDPARDLEFGDNTEPGGLVHLRGLLPGSYEVRVTCKGALAPGPYPPLVVRDRDLLDQVWRVEPGHTISGVLVDADGRPVAGATLAAQASDPGPHEAISDDAGRFSLRGLPPGPVRVVPVAHPRRTMPDAPTTVTIVDADIDALRLVLAATGELRGHLRDPRGRPIAGAVVSVHSQPGELRTFSADDGSFDLASAAVGRAVIAVQLAGAPLPLQPHASLEIRRDRPTTIELVAATPTTTLTGVLRDSDGQPVVGALIELRPDGSPAPAQGLWRTGGERPRLSDAAGRFVVPNLLPVPYTLVARRPGGGELRREHITPGKRPLELLLNAPGRRE